MRHFHLEQVVAGTCLLFSCSNRGSLASLEDHLNVGTAKAPLQANAHWSLSAADIEVEVDGRPYALTIRDASGHIVLQTAQARSSGYTALGWAQGSTRYSPVVIAGYTDFSLDLDAWHDQLVVVDSDVNDESLTLTLQSPEGSRLQVIHRVREGTLRVEAKLLGEVQARAWSTAFTTPEEEGFLGFGERFNRTDQRGKNVWSWIEEGGLGAGEGTEPSIDNPLPSGEMMTYYAVPFFLSTRGYAYWLDTSYRSEFNLASEVADAWRAWHVGKTHAYEVYLPSSADERPWPYHLIDRFTKATGRPMLPPAWAFGPRRRVGRNRMQRGRLEIETMRDLDLAVTGLDDAMHFFPSAHHQGLEKELSSWVQHAYKLGYRVNAYYNSFVDRAQHAPIHSFAEHGRKSDYYVRLAGGQYPDLKILTGRSTPSLYLIDFTNPAASQWYSDSFDWARDLGYSGWMYDFGEYVPANAEGFDGRSGEQLHNLYPVLYARALYNAMQKKDPTGQWFAFQRSGYTGSSAYVPFVWSGDPAASFETADGLPSMIPAGVNLGISGAPHSGGDIGGFHCVMDGSKAADGELLTRWIQMGSMTSNMMDQDACVGGGAQPKASIWSSSTALSAWRTYARLHTRLFPYLYTLAQQAHKTGAPTMRHPFLEHPTHPELRGVNDAYYFGPSLYVAPVLRRGENSVTRLLPPGNFLDWQSQKLILGRTTHTQTVTLSAPLAKLPILLRENRLLPLLDASIDTLADETSSAVVGRNDVSHVYDVVALLGQRGDASLQLWDGTVLHARKQGTWLAPAGFRPVNDDTTLKSCTECYRLQRLADNLLRLQINPPGQNTVAGGLRLSTSGARQIRWDLYLAQ